MQAMEYTATPTIQPKLEARYVDGSLIFNQCLTVEEILK